MDDKCHFIGIGGIGMSALARILLQNNKQVSGSDISTTAMTQLLEKEGAKVSSHHHEENVKEGMTIIYSSSIDDENPEIQAAKKLNCPILHRSDLLLKLMLHKKALVVTGTHGKTSTTGLLSWVMLKGGMDPSYVIGGVLGDVNTNSGHGNGEYFVAEGDESDGTFLKYGPEGGVITNIGLDHMDFYETESAMIESFKRFADKVKRKDLLFVCEDCTRIAGLKLQGRSYGFGSKNSLKGSNFMPKGWGSVFDIQFEGKSYPAVELAVPGKHNALNALGVFGLALSAGVSEESIRNAFMTFPGVARRSEKKGGYHGVTVIDDYAHHPTEVCATLQALRDAMPDKRLIAVFQPHRYTRVKSCRGDFSNMFSEADLVVITDVYSAGEEPIEGISHQTIIHELNEKSQILTSYIPRADLVATLAEKVRPNDVVVMLGAGDITYVSSDLLDIIKKKKPCKLRIGLITGGRSEEHAVAIESAKNIRKGIDPTYYDVTDFIISREGEWCHEKGSLLKDISECDVMFPVLHGPFGEDGTIQGFFEMMGKPYVGMNYRSSAICMDKVMTKKMLAYHNIPTIPFLGVSNYEWHTNPSLVKKQISEKLRFPIFVKGTHLGSSIGVYKVEKMQDLDYVMDLASQFDTDFIIENGIQAREIEFAVLGNEEVKVFPPGEVITCGGVYDYHAKYGQSGMKTTLSPDLDQKSVDKGVALAREAFKAVGGDGMARVDFFLDEQGEYWCNEINPIPGFTGISLYPKICEKYGVPLTILVDHLVDLAMDRARKNCLLKEVNHASV